MSYEHSEYYFDYDRNDLNRPNPFSQTNKMTDNKMTTKALTFRQALNILEEEFDSIYRGISTVKEMTTDLMSAISFEGENPETIYHRFETKVGPNRIVKDDQIIALALHYV